MRPVGAARRMKAMRSGAVTGLSVAGGLLGAALLGCAGQSDPVAPLSGDVPVTIMTYNVAQLTRTGEWGKLENLAEQIAQIGPAFAGVNECEPCEELIDLLPAAYDLVASARAGVSVIYDSSRWTLDDHGFIRLGENDDGFGERVALWARFGDNETAGRVLVYATHWCLRTRSDDDACDVERHLIYADRILRHIRDREPNDLPVILTGDLNIGEQTADEPILGYLAESGLIDAHRVQQPTGDIITLPGAPDNEIIPSRADYILATPPVDIVEAYVDETIPRGTGSDHYPAVATIRFR
jgi:endonuclease/exonuclease/phosphatase family metal-dependent hydrolase